MTLHLSCIDHETPGTGARPRQRQYPETEGWVFVCAAHPFFHALSTGPRYPLLRTTPKNAHGRKNNRPNPSETLRFAARVPYPFSCARRRLPPHHRPATPRWRIFFRWQNPTTNPRGTTVPSTDCRARTRPLFHSHHRRPYPNAHYRTIRSFRVMLFYRASEPHHSQSTQTQA